MLSNPGQSNHADVNAGGRSAVPCAKRAGDYAPDAFHTNAWEWKRM
jgi:hypothetical protein